MWFLLFDRQTQHQKTRQHGFTLIELMLVIALMGVVAFLAVSSFDGDQRESRINVTRLEMVELRKALLQFRRDTREMPCQVYKDGVYNPSFDSQSTLMEEPTGSVDFRSSEPVNNPSDPAKPSTQADYYLWCQDGLRNNPPDGSPEDVIQADNALSMLVRFPYDKVGKKNLLWNRDIKIGWNGPYIDKNGLTDAWGEPYKLIDSGLNYSKNYLCAANASDEYLIEAGELDCKRAQDITDSSKYYLPADIVRLVSTGPDRRLDTTFDETTLADSDPGNWDDPCLPDPDSDDLVLCLLR